MFFTNLSLYEFLGIFAAISGVVVALYLLDRVRKKHRVSSLRFFVMLDREPHYHHRSKFQQPWSLLLQLLAVLLLLLAIADLKIGSAARSAHDHVLILDTSAWMAARSGDMRLIDRARAGAKAFVRALPRADRVMLVRAAALATPATFFESDRQKITRAIDDSQPSAAVLNLEQALEMARETQALDPGRAGEIVFVGAGRVAAGDTANPVPPQNLRLISISGPTENTGLSKFSARRSLASPDTWDVFASVKNYGGEARIAPLVITFGGSPVATQNFTLAPRAEQSATFHFSTRVAGLLEARLITHEPFSLDDRATLELPARAGLPINVYSDNPDLLKPIFDSIPEAQATFLRPAQYTPDSNAAIVVLDRFNPRSPPSSNSIWIEPPTQNSAIQTHRAGQSVKLTAWRAGHPVAAGLRIRDLPLDNAETFSLNTGDVPIAESDAGPVIAAREGNARMIFLGFDPVLSRLKYELATPLLFANILHWMAPGVFAGRELTAGSPGLVNVDLDSDADPTQIRVETEERRPLPFTVAGKALRFFAGSPGIVQIIAPRRNLVYSLTLPQPGDTVWRPAGVRTGIPVPGDYSGKAHSLWPWLALTGAILLIADWLLFGRGGRRIVFTRPLPRRIQWRKAS